ncbi:MAG: hypothetical protein A2499_16165 [Stygiobacter sp. RIFOXYC12_FULL_38_8]|nr:MAG: hypothetical protein A2X62_08180 [Stygiobacter sp. GWC2_38_9]OGU81667.1 MAG: hypothetical protein A2279_10135 [Stygiobacter sp. RIFOXYA12_FULL_38_9]OGV12431.1 MAG: hypothetical protein A2440_14340 [Stygiobacter sp. RIFOXYC2_FULL_38_25]OGV24061.1 MAG: hypothetical protein A2499_16165 [Stygiobacter sp. RIFOXYC12_FULL_38_8]RJQ62271.1 MAG: hypothetical protein C4517_06730 [Stygiobacter sp.]
MDPLESSEARNEGLRTCPPFCLPAVFWRVWRVESGDSLQLIKKFGDGKLVFEIFYNCFSV